MRRRMRAARVVTTWTTAAGGALGAPLALAARKPALAVAFYACAHACLSRVSRTRPEALAALAWAACGAGVCASTSGFSTCALQAAPALAAHAHARAVSAFRAELLTVIKAGREAAVDCARAFAQRLRAGNANAKSALDDVANESFFLIDEHVGKAAKHSETDYRGAFLARRTAAGVLLAGVLTALLFAAAGAPVAHALGVAAVSAAAAAAATAVNGDALRRLGEDGLAADEEVGLGERAAAAVRAGSNRESYVVYALAVVACVGASLDADPLGGLAATTVHFAGAYAFASGGAPTDAAPAFLGVLVFVLAAG